MLSGSTANSRVSTVFNINFRITLFKLFIISKFDSCSTLFYFNNFSNALRRLERNFAKALKSYLNIKIRDLNLSEQYLHLKTFRLLPLKLRFFQNKREQHRNKSKISLCQWQFGKKNFQTETISKRILTSVPIAFKVAATLGDHFSSKDKVDVQKNIICKIRMDEHMKDDKWTL